MSDSIRYCSLALQLHYLHLTYHQTRPDSFLSAHAASVCSAAITVWRGKSEIAERTSDTHSLRLKGYDTPARPTLHVD